MAMYCRFKSAKECYSIPIDCPFISVGLLKRKIYESKRYGKGRDFDILLSNAETNEEYYDEALLVPRNSSLIIHRLPGIHRQPILTRPNLKTESLVAEEIQHVKIDDSDDFGADIYSVTATHNQSHITNPVPDLSLKDVLIGFGRKEQGSQLKPKYPPPPPGYICRRCKVPGHFIHHCPTNGDPKFDIKRVLQRRGSGSGSGSGSGNGPQGLSLDGSYALPNPNGEVAVLKPDKTAFEMAIPSYLKCPLCQQVMKSAVMTRKCCFRSFCDKCIRDHAHSNSKCVCGDTNMVADDLLPNKTLRETIHRIMESSCAATATTTPKRRIVESSCASTATATPKRRKISSSQHHHVVLGC